MWVCVGVWAYPSGSWIKVTQWSCEMRYNWLLQILWYVSQCETLSVLKHWRYKVAGIDLPYNVEVSAMFDHRAWVWSCMVWYLRCPSYFVHTWYGRNKSMRCWKWNFDLFPSLYWIIMLVAGALLLTSLSFIQILNKLHVKKNESMEIILSIE